ncbi:hypothetical protein MHB50_18800 [Siminovitchia sp. FSL H7-0308]|uniref:Uncharacterized protein n=1 Tax=Siminovitchia thermophila TaxID=1245522 RepID=A0ABS2R931_9BACI|nr:hypothetical protein [Siminovitchia thermophila]MBM7716156.1 hypothetical protein [Siminovitchia thermophila]
MMVFNSAKMSDFAMKRTAVVSLLLGKDGRALGCLFVPSIAPKLNIRFVNKQEIAHMTKRVSLAGLISFTEKGVETAISFMGHL